MGAGGKASFVAGLAWLYSASRGDVILNCCTVGSNPKNSLKAMVRCAIEGVVRTGEGQSRVFDLTHPFHWATSADRLDPLATRQRLLRRESGQSRVAADPVERIGYPIAIGYPISMVATKRVDCQDSSQGAGVRRVLRRRSFSI